MNNPLVSLNFEIGFMARVLASKKEQIPFWFDLIEKFIRNQTSLETQKAYLIDLKQFFKWAHDQKIEDFKSISFKKAIEYRDYIKVFGGKQVNGTGERASNSTVHRKICALSSFYEFVAKEILIKTNRSIENPFKRVDRFKIDDSITTTEALIKKELKELMIYIDSFEPTLINLRDRAIIKTLFSVIIRNKAFINLKGKDFYAVGDRFRLKYIDKGEKVFDETLNAHTAAAIIDYLEAMKKENREVFEEDPLFQPVFDRKNKIPKKHFSINQITNILKRHCKRAGVGDWVTSHSAKATVTSELVEKFGVHIAQRKTKHKKTDQVVAYYGKRREREVSVFDDLSYLNQS